MFEPSDMGKDTSDADAGRPDVAPRIESSMRPNCLSKSDCASLSAKHCKGCAAKVRATPAYRTMMSKAKKRALADPEARERVAEAARFNLVAWHRTVDWREFHGHRLDHIPADRRDEYRRLQKRFGADEALRMIREDIALTGRREVERIKADLIAKHHRELAQRY